MSFLEVALGSWKENGTSGRLMITLCGVGFIVL